MAWSHAQKHFDTGSKLGGKVEHVYFMRGHPGRSAFSARLRESRRSIPWVKIMAV